MTQTVPKKKTFFPALKPLAAALVLLASAGVNAQTYTTRAAGNWNSASTWVGGSMPGTSIGAGKTVIVKHAVAFDESADLSVAGTLSILGDTLRFDNGYNKKIILAATGVLSIRNGGLLQNVSEKNGEIESNGARIVLENARLAVGKLFKSLAGTKKTLKNSYLVVGDKYEMEGTSTNRSIDTVRFSTIESAAAHGVFDIKDYCTFSVDNANLIVGKEGLRIESNSVVKVLPGATGNYGIKLLRVEKDLENNGSWDARIDAFCIGGTVKGTKYMEIDFTRPEDCDMNTTTAPAPELSFTNPVLIKGTANKEGAEYRFANITPGIDAVIKLKKFSRSDIVMKNIDNSTLGWNKAFQPEFGLPGLVAPLQNWYVDFEMNFFETGTTQRKKVQKADFTALDVDGDGLSIAEYAVFSNPANIAFSSISSLGTTQAGSLGSVVACGVCTVPSILAQCPTCQGVGEVNDVPCGSCSSHGVIHAGCNHPYEGMIGNILQGPVQNYANIDTNGTAVMATYQYVNVDRINFRYGAKSGSVASNGAGIRLNSLWSKSFSLTPTQTLPVKFASFNVMYDKTAANLSWNAPHSGDLNYFLVQRSTDGKTFNTIATVFGGTQENYNYKDKNLPSAAGVVYYRVVSVDYALETLTSATKMIRLGKGADLTLSIAAFPNPARTSVNLTLPAAWQNQPLVAGLYNAAGIEVRRYALNAVGQTETLDVSALAPGIYVVRLHCNGQTAEERLVKQ